MLDCCCPFFFSNWVHSHSLAQHRLCENAQTTSPPSCHMVHMPALDPLWGHNKWRKLLFNFLSLSLHGFCDRCVFISNRKFKARRGFSPRCFIFIFHPSLCHAFEFSSQPCGGLSWRMLCLPPLSTAPAEGCPSKRCWSTFSLSWISPASDWLSTRPKSQSNWWNWMNKG